MLNITTLKRLSKQNTRKYQDGDSNKWLQIVTERQHYIPLRAIRNAVGNIK